MRINYLKLLSQVQARDYGPVALNVLCLEIVEQTSALTNHLEKAPARVMVLFVLLDVLVQMVNSGGKYCYLYLW